jgi:hypothetical protein
MGTPSATALIKGRVAVNSGVVRRPADRRREDFARFSV